MDLTDLFWEMWKYLLGHRKVQTLRKSMNKPFATDAMIFAKNMLTIFITNPPLSL